MISNNGGNQHDKLHRDNDLPAIICANGDQQWYQNGKLHRDNDLPAIIYADGDQFWYQRGKLHRNNDLPASIDANGDQHWYQHDELHRDNGLPAIIDADGTQEWYIRNNKLTPIQIAAMKLRISTQKYHTIASLMSMHTYLPREMTQIIMQFV